MPATVSTFAKSRARRGGRLSVFPDLAVTPSRMFLPAVSRRRKAVLGGVVLPRLLDPERGWRGEAPLSSAFADAASYADCSSASASSSGSFGTAPRRWRRCSEAVVHLPQIQQVRDQRTMTPFDAPSSLPDVKCGADRVVQLGRLGQIAADLAAQLAELLIDFLSMSDRHRRAGRRESMRWTCRWPGRCSARRAGRLRRRRAASRSGCPAACATACKAWSFRHPFLTCVPRFVEVLEGGDHAVEALGHALAVVHEPLATVVPAALEVVGGVLQAVLVVRRVDSVLQIPSPAARTFGLSMMCLSCALRSQPP